MSIKIIGLIKLLDSSAFDEYRSQVGATIQRYQGTVLFRGALAATYWNELQAEQPDAMVEIEFPSADDAARWASSDEYRALLDARGRAMRLTLLGFA